MPSRCRNALSGNLSVCPPHVGAGLDRRRAGLGRTHAVAPAAGEHRAEQSTLLAGLIHQRWTDPKFGGQLDELSNLRARKKSAPDPAAVVVRRLKRLRDKRVKLPQTLVEELARTGDPGPAGVARGPRKGRFPFVQAPAGADHRAEAPAGRVPGLRRLPLRRLARRVRAGRAFGQHGPSAGGACARNWCRWWPACQGPAADPTPRSSSGRSGRRAGPVCPRGSHRHRVRFQRGRLDVTAHPFCTTLGPHDCRITTRYNERFFNPAFFGVLHEAGHGIYEQGLPTGAIRAADGRGDFAGHSRVAIAALGEPRRPQPGLLDALLPLARRPFPPPWAT